MFRSLKYLRFVLQFVDEFVDVGNFAADFASCRRFIADNFNVRTKIGAQSRSLDDFLRLALGFHHHRQCDIARSVQSQISSHYSRKCEIENFIAAVDLACLPSFITAAEPSVACGYSHIAAII